MRKLIYNVNGLTFNTMKDAQMVAKAAGTKAIPKLVDVDNSKRQTKERYEAVAEYFKKRKMKKEKSTREE